ncbi:hypothetical protein ES288_D12G299000v1 [Gossypium darwinii]|uniref:Uncharacterized protein n=1 Tax=Gossypium darwinii TaxID=34276 RepID=A0A5D2AGJ2_GOSDA|nr:hypothetical protein ES288_D12G299000v1 [Gossypium darwinii]
MPLQPHPPLTLFPSFQTYSSFPLALNKYTLHFPCSIEPDHTVAGRCNCNHCRDSQLVEMHSKDFVAIDRTGNHKLPELPVVLGPGREVHGTDQACDTVTL